MPDLDIIDRKILSQLQTDGRMQHQALILPSQAACNGSTDSGSATRDD